MFAFARWADEEQLLIVSSFKDEEAQAFRMQVPADLIKKWKLKDGTYTLIDQLYGSENELTVENGTGFVKIALEPLQSFIYRVK